ncbi:TrbG/VirB9 family P-type conjugative transfer protein [Burkholderia sp. Ac-20345]|uniref:TrbG/VirB9 family P-type conjugative transfer protein n=1 Tax=Burkholderia sp. Ac-20345 TaxID=2703891 RepID=UPI0032163BB8
MKLSLKSFAQLRFIVAVVSGLAMSACATAPLPAASNQNYDFAYRTTGGSDVRPSQVFDDGSKTYFQFPVGKTAPVIQLDDAGDHKLLEPNQEGIYYTVPFVANRFVFQRGQETGVAEYDGPKPHVVDMSRVNQPGTVPASHVDMDGLYAVTQRNRPVYVHQAMQANSYATPVVGDNASWATELPTEDKFDVQFKRGSSKLLVPKRSASSEILSAAKKASRVVIMGRDDDSMMETLAENRAGAVRDWLVKNGVPPSVINVTADTSGADGLDAEIRVYSKPAQVPVNYASPDSPAFKADAIKADVQAGVLSREEGARRLASLAGYGNSSNGDNSSGTGGISLRSTLAVFAEKEHYQLTWGVGVADKKITVPPVDREPNFDAKLVDLGKAGAGACNLGVDKEAKLIYAEPDLGGLAKINGKAGIETLSEANSVLTVKLRTSPKTMYAVDRVDNSDIAVKWTDPTAFTMPVREKMELTLDGKTLDLTHVGNSRYVVVLQPTAGTTTK